jgi:hypothetical protein
MEPSDFDPELEDLNERATGRLLCAETFDSAAFASLKEHLCRKAEAAKTEPVISKQVLSCLRGASQAIRNQASYVPGAKENIELADEFDVLLDLMIKGEGWGDRVPGVPRIV